MAPAAKKAKIAAKPVAGGGLKTFFGGSAPKAPAQEAAPAAAAPAEATQASAGDLNDEQRLRIEENRRRALELKRAKREREEAAATTPQAAEAPQPAATEEAQPAAEPPAQPPAKAKAAGKGAAKAAAKGAAKAKAKAAAKGTAAKDPEASPERPASGAARPAPNVAETTPEKTAAPGSQASEKARQAPREPGKFDRFSSGAWMEYNSLYAARLGKLHGAAMEQARTLWGGMLEPGAFKADLSGYSKSGPDNEAVLVGILHRSLQGRPNVISQYQNQKIGELPSDCADGTKLCSDDDQLWLEDRIMRIQLEMAPEFRTRLATGLVVAVRGAVDADGHFVTSSVCFPKLPSPSALPAPESPSAPGHYVALVSGLTATPEGGVSEELAAARAKCAEYLRSGAVRQVVICGGTLAGAGKEGAKEALKEADALLSSLAERVPVCVMPGRDDPTNMSLPQMPLHPHLFKRVHDHKANFRAVSNPFSGSVGGAKLLGHSGQPIEDLMRCTGIETPLEALMTTLEAQHLAPTAPDTLAAQPFVDSDPFVMDEVPHVLFAGGCDRAAHGWQPASRGDGGTICVCVPTFHKHTAAILVNLHDPQDVRVEDFGASA